MFDSESTTIPSRRDVPAFRAGLADRIQAVLGAATRTGCRVRRVSVPVSAEASPLDWLRAQDADEATYWSSRDGERAVAGVGAADVVRNREVPIDYEGLRSQLRDRLGHAPASARYYGGLRFDASQPRAPNGPDRSWDAFETYRFVLPRFELVVEDGRAVLACNLVLPRDADCADALRSAVETLAPPSAGPTPSLPAPLGRADAPDKAEWIRMVEWALDAIDDDTLDKVVLARRVALDLGTALDPFLVTRRLQSTAPNCFHFAIRPAGSATFVGASPERLFCRSGDRVESEAVAGTRSRGDTPEADLALRQELLNSPKERREHAFVQRAIHSDLDALCVSMEAPDAPGDLALSRRRHLHAPITGRLHPDACTIDLIEALHPTPAVGGVPRDAALRAIRSREPFDRGWYAGPVGWIGSNSADFAVAIRSGLIQDARLALFSGAGIVDGSVPEREWEEIEQKIADFAAIMGLNGRKHGRDQLVPCR